MKEGLKTYNSCRLFAVLVASMAISVCAHADTPRLFLNIVIEGLDYDRLQQLMPHLGKNGFRRLVNTGVTVVSADYGTPLDNTAAIAMLMTGAAPSANGVGAEKVFDPVTGRCNSVFSDDKAMGTYTSETLSGKNLLVSTLADEVRIAGDGITYVYTVAPDAAGAIAISGHAVNSALWIDSYSGNWASSTYYKDVPTAIGARNKLSPLTSRLDTISWTPSLKNTRYEGIPEVLTHYPFRYTFPRTVTDRIENFKRSAMVNREVTDVAAELIELMHLGTHEGVDMVNVIYRLDGFRGGKQADMRYEMADSYIKVDAWLGSLITAAERKAPGAVAVMVAGIPSQSGMRRDDERWQIPSGEFSTRRALSLLNVYLMAKFGTGEWMKAYNNGWFYINNDLLSQSSVNPVQLRTMAAEFLSRMEGVKAVYTLDDVIAGRAGDNPQALRRNTVVSQSGDLLIEILPGWEINDDAAILPQTAAEQHVAHRDVPTVAPVFIMAPGLSAAKIDTPVDVRVITPTVSRILRIRSPNGASLPPLSL
ncbi:MAG: alkaline phosphatase family protein [Muribaculaceae bacterium]|nr:alkaline phosphatase family protein [Muribaculaceae bacterium]